MRKIKVRHQRLPGIGELFEFVTAAGLRVGVVTHRSGRHGLVVSERGADEPVVTAVLTQKAAAALAAPLTDAHVELTTDDIA